MDPPTNQNIDEFDEIQIDPFNEIFFAQERDNSDLYTCISEATETNDELEIYLNNTVNVPLNQNNSGDDDEFGEICIEPFSEIFTSNATREGTSSGLYGTEVLTNELDIYLNNQEVRNSDTETERNIRELYLNTGRLVGDEVEDFINRVVTENEAPQESLERNVQECIDLFLTPNTFAINPAVNVRVVPQNNYVTQQENIERDAGECLEFFLNSNTTTGRPSAVNALQYGGGYASGSRHQDPQPSTSRDADEVEKLLKEFKRVSIVENSRREARFKKCYRKSSSRFRLKNVQTPAEFDEEIDEITQFIRLGKGF